MKGSKPQRLPAPSAVFGVGRSCEEPGCQTALSQYNAADLCWQHAEITFPNHRGKRLRPAPVARGTSPGTSPFGG